MVYTPASDWGSIKWAYKGRKLLSICLLLVVIFFSSRIPAETMKLVTSKSYFSQVTKEEIKLSNAVLNGSDKTTKIVRVFTNIPWDAQV